MATMGTCVELTTFPELSYMHQDETRRRSSSSEASNVARDTQGIERVTALLVVQGVVTDVALQQNNSEDVGLFTIHWCIVLTDVAGDSLTSKSELWMVLRQTTGSHAE